MKKIKIDPSPNAYRLLNPGAVALISVGDGKADNLFSVTWNMPLRRDFRQRTLFISIYSKNR